MCIDVGVIEEHPESVSPFETSRIVVDYQGDLKLVLCRASADPVRDTMIGGLRTENRDGLVSRTGGGQRVGDAFTHNQLTSALRTD